MKRYFLGMDYGTGGCKACIIDESAAVLAYAYREYPILTNNAGYSEHRAADYWPATCSMIRECVERAGIPAERVACVGVSSALPSLVMIDRAGAPVHNAYNLLDRRAIEEERALRENPGAARIFALTGNRIEDHPILVNLLWEKKHRPQDYARIDKALTIDGYIRYCLTGRATAHLSAGPFYGVAYDLRARRFDREELARLGIDEAILPALYRCDAIIGEITERAARDCGLAPGTPVAGGQVDCNAGWIGGGALEPGDIQMNLGTCGNFGVVHRGERFLDTMFNFPYTLDCENTYITVSTTQTGGQTLRYLKEQFSHLEVAMERLLPGADCFDYLNREAERVPPGCEGLLALPYLMGERTPIWDNDARGVLFGLTLSHTKGHLVRAMMEGVAYALCDSFCIFQQQKVPMNFPIVMNEGGAKSKLWRRIITDVLGVPTVLVKNRVGAPYGDALLAAVACGALPDYGIARERAEYVEPMEPDDRTHGRYQAYFALYRDLYQHLREDFAALARLREEERDE